MTDASGAARPPFGRGVRGNRWDELCGGGDDGGGDDDVTGGPPTVSVVVVHYRQQRQLDRTLAALARQSYPADRVEIIVVDDGSPEAPRVAAGVTLLIHDDRGFRLSAARNLGAARASGTILFFLDADTAPEPEYLARMVRLPALAPEAVVVGHRRHADLAGVPPEARIEQAAPARELPEPRWLLDEYARSGDLLRSDHRSYRFVIGAVIACSRWFFEEVGGFDETFTEYGGEDWEWAHRAWIDGALFAHVPDAIAWHDGPDWEGRDERERRAQKNRETLRLASRVPVVGSRGLGVRPGRVDVLVRLLAAPSPSAAFVAVDSFLAALPHAVVEVPADVASTFADDPRVIPAGSAVGRPRVVVDVTAPLRVDDPDPLRLAVDEVGVDELGGLVFHIGGAPLLTVASRRADRRRARWQQDLFDTEARDAPWARTIDAEPELAAYLGGWA